MKQVKEEALEHESKIENLRLGRVIAAEAQRLGSFNLLANEIKKRAKGSVDRRKWAHPVRDDGNRLNQAARLPVRRHGRLDPAAGAARV